MADLSQHLPSTFKDAAEGMDTDELRNEILEATEKIKETKVTRGNDLNYERAREAFNDLKGGYADTIKSYQAKIEHAMEILRLRGVSISGKTVNEEAQT
jgi:protoporphyrinogen oxidase